MATRVRLAFYILCILLCSLHGVVTATSDTKKPLHLTYFVHEILDLGVANSTVLLAAGSGLGNFSAIGWGTIMVFDSPIKSGNTSNSLLLGSSTGSFVLTTVSASGGSQINGQHIFTQYSKYNGSSLTVIGTIPSTTPPFEINIPGGTGSFRGYSGYAIATPLTEAAPHQYVYQWDVYITYKN